MEYKCCRAATFLDRGASTRRASRGRRMGGENISESDQKSESREGTVPLARPGFREKDFLEIPAALLMSHLPLLKEVESTDFHFALGFNVSSTAPSAPPPAKWWFWRYLILRLLALITPTPNKREKRGNYILSFSRTAYRVSFLFLNVRESKPVRSDHDAKWMSSASAMYRLSLSISLMNIFWETSLENHRWFICIVFTYNAITWRKTERCNWACSTAVR